MNGLPAFELERWLRRLEPKAKLAIGGSGVARGDLAPFLPRDGSEWARWWAMGLDEATRAVQDAVARAYGVDAREVLPTAGASEADLVAVLGLAGAGARVVVERPAYHSLLAPALALGCRVTRVLREAPAFRLDPAAVIDAMGRDARLVLLASPHNPTGARMPDDDLRAIAEHAARTGAWVVVDEVFADATDAGDRPARLLHERIVSVGSVTKCLGFSPLRVGWLAAHPDAQEALDRAKAHASVQTSLIGQLLAARVLAERRRLVARTRELRARNAGVLRRAVPAWRDPGHGTTAVLPLRNDIDDIKFSERLLTEEGVLVAPGSFIELPGWVRVGLVGPTDVFEAGMAVLALRL